MLPKSAVLLRSSGDRMVDAIYSIWGHRRILLATAWADIRARYIGTAGGIAWLFLYPMLFLGLYALVYTVIFRVQPVGMTTEEYLLFIFSGLVPFLGFAEALGAGVPAVIANKSLIRNTLFPIELIPLKTVLTSSVSMLIGFSLLVSVIVLRGQLQWTILFLFPILILNLLFTCGIVWLLSTLNVFIRDIGNMVPLLTIVLMLISPIAYSESQVPASVLPIMKLNPLFHIIGLYRSALFGGAVDFSGLVLTTVGAVALFVAGYHVFTRLKIVFVEYV
jgi:lipopolysaccharide transport system permease protein